jgi:hypothetical protein
MPPKKKKSAPESTPAPKIHRRSKTVHYKRARFIGETRGITLAQALDVAISRGRPMDRLEKTAVEGEEQDPDEPDKLRVINACYRSGSMIVGPFLDYTHGGATLVLTLDPTADELSIEELPPPDKKQHVGGILYFGVRDNHVLLVQTSSLRSGHFENHLNWLLKEHTHVLDDSCRVFIEDEPQRQLTDKLDVDWIELHTPISVSKFLETEKTPKGPIGRLIHAFQQEVSLRGTFYERLSPEEALRLQDVELSLKIKRKGRGQKRTGPSLVDEIAHTLRHIDDIDFVLQTTGGATITNKELKLAQSFPIQCKPGGQLELDAVAEAMQQYLSRLIVQRHVEERR